MKEMKAAGFNWETDCLDLPKTGFAGCALLTDCAPGGATGLK